MDKESIQNLLDEVAGISVDTKEANGWLSSHCPLAPWTHERGTDRNMSFGITIREGENSIYNCLTCHNKGTLTMLLKKLSYLSGEDYSGLIDEVDSDELLGAVPQGWDAMRSGKKSKHRLPTPPSSDYLLIYDKAGTHPYLSSRGIDAGLAEELDLRVDPDDHGEERILFPVYSPRGVFYGYTGRAVRNKVEPKIRDYFGLPKRHLLLGAEWINNTWDRYIVLVEGLFDFAKVFMFGAPVVASLHANLTEEQASILKDVGLPIVVMYDNDKAGREGTLIVKDMLGSHVPLSRVRYPKDETIRDKRTNKKRPPSDPGELTERQFWAMVEKSRLL